MSEHGHHQETPQPVLVPFLLLCLAILVIFEFGAYNNTQINVERYAGEGLAGVNWSQMPPAGKMGQ
ncbi:MAG TPA: hypothetical protein VGO93_02730 [Candidatus Xenobia bacterium]|jgi:hypothetical protein